MVIREGNFYLKELHKMLCYEHPGISYKKEKEKRKRTSWHSDMHDTSQAFSKTFMFNKFDLPIAIYLLQFY